jgi:amino acid transporter
MRRPSLVRSLGLADATLLVIGCIVGVGIFRTAAGIAAQLPSASAILALWLLGGVVSLAGALCYAELAAMFPRTGGDYVYVTQTYGRFWGFLFGWTKLFVERTGTIAILGFVFAEYLGKAMGYGPVTTRWIASLSVLALTTINVVGIRWGTLTQNVLSSLKIGALGAIVLIGMAAGGAHSAWLAAPAQPVSWSAWGVAFVFVLWTYGGWTEAAYVAEEVRDPERHVPRAIIGGVLLTTVLYLAVNATYLRYIPAAEMPGTPLVAATMMERALGPIGAQVITWMVACSAFGALNGYILTGGRILYAVGQDHRLFAALGVVDPRFRTPARALWLVAAISILLVFTKTFDQIMTYSTVAISVFFLLTAFAVIRLRRTHPELPRPYRVWGYPITPLVYGLVVFGFILNVLVKEPVEALFGLGLVALGLPLYRISGPPRVAAADAPASSAPATATAQPIVR